MEIEMPFKNIKEIYRNDFTVYEDIKYTFFKEKEGELDYYKTDNYYERYNKLYIKDPNGVLLVGTTMENGDEDDLQLQDLDSTFKTIK